MKKTILTFMGALLIATGCQQGQPVSNNQTSAAEENDTPPYAGLKDLEVLEDATHFYVIGDWGRNGFENQQAVADAMHQTTKVIEPEFIFSTGDNFYPNGIASVNDPYWQTSYEQVYKGNLLYCPWYVALGNHDYRGNVEAQIDYSNISKRWTMPSRYFSIDKVLEDDETTARFIVIDTSPFEDDYYGGEKYGKAVASQDTAKQMQWVEGLLANNTKDWTIVIGHHPFYTSGKRIEDEPYVRNHFEPVFEKYSVHAAFFGHEHDLQHQKPDNIFTHHFVSGAGSEVRPTGKLPYTKFAEAVPGFMIVSLTKESMLVQAVDKDGNVVYKTNIAHAVNEPALAE